MTLQFAFCCAAALLSAPALPASPAQDAAPTEQAEQAGQAGQSIEVSLRVTASGPGKVVTVDHGSSDGLADGDAVDFKPKDGSLARGVILQVDARTSLVELIDVERPLPPGTRGSVFVPVSRFAPPSQPAEPEVAAPVEHPPWQNQDKGYDKGMPLLAQVGAVRPEERARRASGRIYLIGDSTFTSDSERSDSFWRLGGDAVIENPFGRGGGLSLDAELSTRNTSLPDGSGADFSRVRIDRASYYEGGDRFSARRWEVGRFLQHGLAEFGVLDGGEWSTRRDNGDSFGFSAGFMPEPNTSQESGKDFQVAGYYRWVSDEREQVTWDNGFQKTFHNGNGDRDLLVSRFRCLPLDGWDFHGTAWIDVYGGDDDPKNSGVDLTQARLSTGRRWSEGNDLYLTFQRVTFPVIDRDEFLPPTLDELADAHYERLSLAGSHRTEGGWRTHGEVGGWVDEREQGADSEVGLEVRDLFSERSIADLTLYASFGRFSSATGGRASFGRFMGAGRWDVSYELSNQHLDGFSPDRNDLFQHRIRASASFVNRAGWSFSFHGTALLWDTEGAYTFGLYLQKGF